MDGNWLPTAVSGGLLGIIFFYIRSSRTELTKDFKEHRDHMESEITDIETQREVNKEKYLMKKEHDLLCDNASLKINQHLTEEMQSLKDSIFTILRAIQDDIAVIKKNGNGK